MNNQMIKNIFQPILSIQNHFPYKTLFFVFSLLLQGEVSADEVGSIPGSFGVSPSGAANYSISIDVPKGINGSQPSLALVYDSQSGNGVLGQGWSLSGLSSITRCPKTLAQDGEIHGVDFTNKDRLCMDGQRLVLISGSNVDSEYWATNAEYRTEIESFSKITREGNSYFKVETKAGRIAEYGNSDIVNNSIQNVKIISSGEIKELSWAINKINDLSGNSMAYIYDEDVNNGEHYINRIEYAGNTNASVDFIYDDRPDFMSGYLSGSKVNTPKRLIQISIKSGAAVVSDYFLTYEVGVSTARSRLKQIQKCSGSNDCLPETIFDWSDRERGTFNKIYNVANVDGTYKTWRSSIADFNGDGLADVFWQQSDTSGRSTGYHILWLGNGDGTFNKIYNVANVDGTYKTWRSSIADFNGDGLADVFWQQSDTSGRSTGYHILWLGNGDGTFNKIYNVANVDGTYKTWRSSIADFNGDGLADVFWQQSDTSGRSTGYHILWLGNGDGTFNKIYNVANVDGTYKTWRSSIADFNGDGLADVFWQQSDTSGRSTGYHILWLGNGDGTFNKIYNVANVDGTYKTWRSSIADFNGDGLADVFWQQSDTSGRSTGYHILWLGNGDGTFNKIYNVANVDGTYKTWRSSIADFNGDGLADVFWQQSDTSGRSTGYHILWLGNGDGTFNKIYNVANVDGTYKTWRSSIADFNGDGLADVFWQQSDTSGRSTGYHILWLGNGDSADMLTSITGGFGQKTDISYSHLTDDSTYYKYGDAKYPILDFQAPMQVVSSVSNDNALGAQNTTTYKYGGMKIHHLGRGSLGFRWTESTDVQTDITTRNEFAQVRLDENGSQEPDFPLGGNVLSSEKRLSNGKLINSIDNILAETSGYPSSPYVSQSISIENDLDSAVNGQEVLISTVQKDRILDADGNPTYEKTTSYELDGTTHVVEVDREFNTVDGIAPFERSQVLLETSTSTGVDGVISLPSIKEYAYNPTGLLQTETRQPGSSAYEMVTSYGYDSFGNRTSVTVNGADIESRTSTTQYDTSGRFPEVTTNAYSHTQSSVFDPVLGVVLSVTDRSDLTATNSYDGFGRLTNTIAPNGTMIATSRDWCTTSCTVDAIDVGLSPQQIAYSVTSRYLGSDGITEYKPSVTKYFDKLSREVRTETSGFDGQTIYQDTNYDVLGRVSATTQVYDVTRPDQKNPTLNTGYDVLGRLRQQVSPQNGLTDIDYSSLVTTTTNNGRTKKETKNAIGQLIAVEDALNQVQTYEYNAIRKRIKTTDSMGNVLAVGYDDLGRKISMNDPDMGQWSYTYDVLGQLKTQTDAKGQITKLYYDKLGRKRARVDSDNTVTNWDYDDDLTAGGVANIGVGRLYTEFIKAPSTEAFDEYKIYSYNEYGQPAQVISAYTDGGFSMYAIDTAYDEYGRIDTITYPASTAGASTIGDPSRFKVKYAYQNGYLKSVSNPEGTEDYWTATARNAKGQLTITTHGNGVMTSQDYDEAGRQKMTDVGIINSYFRGDYMYDSVGNLDNCSIYHGAGSQQTVVETHGYDLLNRLTSVNSPTTGLTSYEYDGLGNIKLKGGNIYDYDGSPHAVTKVGATSYVYDLNGNMISGGGRTIAWSPFNKPVQIDNASTGISFKYGTDRSRYQQTKLDKSTGNTDTITYIGGLMEVIEKPTVTEYKHYISAGKDKVVLHLLRSNATEETSYLHKDRLGSLVVVTDETGAAKANFSYDVFGANRSIDGEASISPLVFDFTRLYTDHERLNDVGLIHMNGRVFDPELGRFISADPFIQFQTNQQSYNRYSYVLNNPLGYTDPSGYRLKCRTCRRIGGGLKKAGGLLLGGFVNPYIPQLAIHGAMIRRSETYRKINGFVTPLIPVPGVAAANGAFTAYVLDASNAEIFWAGVKAGAASYANGVLKEWGKTTDLSVSVGEIGGKPIFYNTAPYVAAFGSGATTSAIYGGDRRDILKGGALSFGGVAAINIVQATFFGARVVYADPSKLPITELAGGDTITATGLYIQPASGIFDSTTVYSMTLIGNGGFAGTSIFVTTDIGYFSQQSDLGGSSVQYETDFALGHFSTGPIGIPDGVFTFDPLNTRDTVFNPVFDFLNNF